MHNLVPTKFLLSQNFPNPFRDETKIKYCLPFKIKVNLSVFDSSGKKVKELVNKIQEAGTYEIKLRKFDLPAGHYFYQMQVIDSEPITGQIFVSMKKMQLIK